MRLKTVQTEEANVRGLQARVRSYRTRYIWLALAASAAGIGLVVGFGRLAPFLVYATGGIAASVFLLGLNLGARTDMAARLTVWLALLVLMGVGQQKTAEQVAVSPLFALDVAKGGVMIVALLLVVTTRHLSLFPRTRAEALLFLYLAIAVASAIWSAYPRATVLAALQLVSAYLLILALVRLRSGSLGIVLRDIAAVAYLLVVSSLVGLIVAPDLAFDVGGPYSPSRRLRGLVPSISLNMLGFMSAVALLMLFARVGPRWTQKAIPRLALAGCAVATLLLCRTRSSLALVLIGIVAMLVMTPRRRPLFIVGVAVLVAGLLFAASALERYVVPFLERDQTSAQLWSLTGRTQNWQVAFGFWQERPVLGYGFYAGHRTGPFVGELDIPVSNLDSMWIETLLDVGLVGLFALAGFVLLSSTRVLRLMENPPIAKALVLVCLVNSFYNPSLQKAQYTMLVWSLVLLAQRQTGSSDFSGV